MSKFIKELFRRDVLETTFEDLHIFFPDRGVSLMMPDKSGYPCLTQVMFYDFADYCASLESKWGSGNLVVTDNCGSVSIEFTNPDFMAMRAKHGQRKEARYDS